MASVFISYCHADQDLRGRLQTHLALLRRQGHIDIWTDHCIRPGEAFDGAISDALESADLILLLLSPDFINSEDCYGVEMKRALERAASGAAEVVSILLRPCDWKSSELGRFKALPTDGHPIVKFPTLDDGLLDVVTQLRAMLTPKKPASEARNSASAPDAARTSTPTLGWSDGNPASSQASGSFIPRRSNNVVLPKQFTDLDRAQFASEGYAEVLEYFRNSLEELEKRNGHIKSQLDVITTASFTAAIYSNGKKVSSCGVRRGGMAGTNGITYVASDDPHQGNTANEMLQVALDEFTLGWSPMFGLHRSNDKKLL